MSLFDKLGARVRRPSDRQPRRNEKARVTAWFVLLAAGSAAAGITIGALWQAETANSERSALLVQGEAIGRGREQAAAMAHALSLPPLDAVLASLRTHLPPGVRLIEVARDESGALTLAIDTPDPDALRATLAADARLGRFREQGQAVNDDGTIRVRLMGAVG
jgi:hypothetical protein